MARFLEDGTPLQLSPNEQVALARAPRGGDDGVDWRGLPWEAAEGTSAYLGQNGVRAEQTRLAYADKVRGLDQFANAAREALKTVDRELTPAPERYLIEAIRPEKGPKPGSVGGANRVNPRVTAQARTLGRLGRASAVTSALLGAAEIGAAENKPRAVAQVAGGAAGGWAGGVAGAEALGVLGGLAGPWGATGGAIIGGLLGSAGVGFAGHEAGGRLYDRAVPRRPAR